MLTFLRKIRKSIVESGSTRKYILYAIGEIALVVIGILIALQINNWNEAQKLRKYEIATLKLIKIDLQSSVESLSSCNHFDSLNVVMINSILDHIENNKPYTEQLEEQFSHLTQWATPTVSTGAYETLKSSKGLDVLSNDSLRQKIVSLHERGYSVLFDRYEKEEAMVHKELMLPVFSDLFVSKEDGGAYPVDYTQLSTHQKFINVVTLTRRYRNMSINIESGFKDYILELIKDIDTELIRLE